ncbi:MAG: universal stress protein [Deferrisomatales bacterium]|nr:universal stress protein [Deferrisomatales bacterium]
MSYRKILIPLDGSELAEAAVDAAAPLAKAFGGEILLLGVLDLTAGMYDVYSEAFSPVDLRAQLEKFIENALDRAEGRVQAEGLPARRFLEVGVPHEEISALARREGAELIVMTTHGRKGLTHLLLGSVTEKLIRTAPCPVLVVPPPPAQQGTP